MGKSRTFCWAGKGERRKDRWVTHDSPIFFFLFFSSSHIQSCEGHWFKLHRINELKFAVGTGESYSSDSNCSPVKKCLSPSERFLSRETQRNIPYESHSSAETCVICKLLIVRMTGGPCSQANKSQAQRMVLKPDWAI